MIHTKTLLRSKTFLLLAYFVCWAKPYDTKYTGPFLYAWGQTEDAAKGDALSFCKRRTGHECHVTCKKKKAQAFH